MKPPKGRGGDRALPERLAKIQKNLDEQEKKIKDFKKVRGEAVARWKCEGSGWGDGRRRGDEEQRREGRVVFAEGVTATPTSHRRSRAQTLPAKPAKTGLLVVMRKQPWEKE